MDNSTIKQLLAHMRSSLLMTVIGINVAVWLALRVAAIVVFFATGHDGEYLVSQWVELPSSPSYLATHFYGIVTYMFAQYGVLHLAFNMLWLYWFGRMYLEISSERSLFALYVYGGLAGAVFFLLAYNLLPAFAGHNAWLIGSSAAVLAIVTTTAMLMPDYPVNLLLIGTVRLKWIAIATIVIVLLSITGSNAGGEIAHAGGIVMGAVVAKLRKEGRDITRPFCRMMDALVNLTRRRHTPRPKRGTKARHGAPSPSSTPGRSAADSAELDAILDKVKRSGYGGLTPEERKKLFDISSKIK